MIIKTVKGDILNSGERHIVVPINTEGYISDRVPTFAGDISKRFWPELSEIGYQELGTVISKKLSDGLTIHAIVCYTMFWLDKWENTAKIIQQCFDRINCSDEEEIASVRIGQGCLSPKGTFEEVYVGMSNSSKNIVLYVEV